VISQVMIAMGLCTSHRAVSHARYPVQKQITCRC